MEIEKITIPDEIFSNFSKINLYIKYINDYNTLKLLHINEHDMPKYINEKVDGMTPLHAAIVYHEINTCNFIIEGNVDINAKNVNGFTHLHIACICFYFKMVKLLTDIKKVDINAKDNNGNTPLMISAYKGYHKITKELLSKKASVHERNNTGTTALIAACLNGNIKIINLLLEHGANIHDTNNNGTAMLAFIAFSKNPSKESLELLCQNDVYVDPDDHSFTPLHCACYYGNLKTFELIINMDNIDINAYDKNNKTPFDLAREQHHGDILIKLIEHGAEIPYINSNDDDFMKEVFILAHESNLLTVEAKLLQRGIDIKTTLSKDDQVIFIQNINNYLELQYQEMKNTSCDKIYDSFNYFVNIQDIISQLWHIDIPELHNILSNYQSFNISFLVNFINSKKKKTYLNFNL